MSAMFRLGQRMAQRNNLGLFAWVAAALLPVALQVIADACPGSERLPAERDPVELDVDEMFRGAR